VNKKLQVNPNTSYCYLIPNAFKLIPIVRLLFYWCIYLSKKSQNEFRRSSASNAGRNSSALISDIMDSRSNPLLISLLIGSIVTKAPQSIHQSRACRKLRVRLTRSQSLPWQLSRPPKQRCFATISNIIRALWSSGDRVLLGNRVIENKNQGENCVHYLNNPIILDNNIRQY
jgi:hypothetical protein